jgi:hypothetical protein
MRAFWQTARNCSATATDCPVQGTIRAQALVELGRFCFQGAMVTNPSIRARPSEA